MPLYMEKGTENLLGLQTPLINTLVVKQTHVPEQTAPLTAHSSSAAHTFPLSFSEKQEYKYYRYVEYGFCNYKN